MPLAEEMLASGHWLFRWRGFLPLLLLLLFWAALRDYHYPFSSVHLNGAWELGCLGISLCGATIRALTVAQAPRGTSGRNRKKQRADELNALGMYSIVRHPLYVGNFLASLGACLFLGVWWLPVLFTMIYALYYERIMLAEEGFLRERFGQAYLDWASKTPAVLPRFQLWRRSMHPFSLRKAFREEPQTVLAITAAMYALRVAANYQVTGKLETQLLWNVLLAVAVFAFLALRMLRKFSSVLQDPPVCPSPQES